LAAHQPLHAGGALRTGARGGPESVSGVPRCPPRHESFGARDSRHCPRPAQLALLLDRSGRPVCRHCPKLDRLVPLARGRSLCLLRLFPPAFQSPPGLRPPPPSPPPVEATLRRRSSTV